MRFLLILAALTALCAGNVIPVIPEEINEEIPSIPGDNSHYVEGKSRYVWMPDGKGEPQLVDLHAQPEQSEKALERNGAENQYWLFTRQNPTSRQIIVHNNANSIWNSNYRSARPLKVLVHGWNSNGNSDMNPLITSAFLAVQDCNVIVVDWNRAANSLYNAAVVAVPGVGQFLGNFLQWLINTAGGNWNNTHLVGFSLGAHIVGNAGRTVGSRAARVTGLDPAGPQWGGNSRALNGNDGQYVEIIHTDGGLLGIFDRIGNADFYPNRGRNPQPGCSLSTCSHSRAPQLFAATVRQNHLVGRQCSFVSASDASWWNTCTGGSLQMGNGIITKRGNGIFGLTTGNSWPF